VQIQTRRRRIEYETFGEGTTPLLLVHGNFASSRWWRALGRCLPRRFVAHAPNLPGFAGSPLGGGPVTIASLADDMIDFADALGLERFHLVGHSLGTAVSLEMTLRAPHRVKSLALLAPVPAGGLAVLLESQANLRRWDPRRPFTGSFLHLVHQLSQWMGLQRSVLQKTLMRMMPALATDPQLPELVDDACAMSPRAIVEMFEALLRHDPSLELRRVRSPVLVIAGAEDPLIPIHHARELARRLRWAAMEEYSGVSHGVPLEAPQRLARSLGRLARFGRGYVVWHLLCSAGTFCAPQYGGVD
jgi:pimeloyl-ACP methyl ester carboxylesterase